MVIGSSVLLIPLLRYCGNQTGEVAAIELGVRELVLKLDYPTGFEGFSIFAQYKSGRSYGKAISIPAFNL